MLTINFNPTASNAANTLGKNNANLQKSLARLSSGNRIVNPADDAGGLAVSMRLKAQINRTSGAMTNVTNAMSYLQVQDGALSTTASILDRMSELRAFSDDVTKNTTDIANYNVEFQQLREQLNNIASEKFNGISLFAAGGSSTFNATPGAGTLLSVFTTEAGSGGSQVSVAKIALQSSLNVKGTSAAGSKVIAGYTNATALAGTSDTGASVTAFSVGDIINALNNVATLRANNAALSSRLQFAHDQLSVNKANVEAANSRIIDTDIATESTALARNNILVQSSASMLAQANATSNVALMLLG